MNRCVPCKYILNKENCPYGKKCRFLHQCGTDLKKPIAGPLENQCRRGGYSAEKVPETRLQSPRATKSHVCVDAVSSSEVQDENLKGGNNHGNGTRPELQVTPRVCRFYLLNSRCKYGDKCRYIHSAQEITGKEAPNEGKNKVKRDCEMQKRHEICEGHEMLRGHEVHNRQEVREKVQEGQEVQKGCEMLQKGRKVQESHEGKEGQQVQGGCEGHKGQPRPRNRVENERYQQSSSRNPPPLTLASFIGGRTHVQRPRKAHRNQKESSGSALREIELEQLQVRFPGESCTLLTKSRDKVTYCISFEPSDQDWRGPRAIQLEATFPGSYPKEYCHVELSSGQDLSEDAITCGNQEIQDYWKPDMLGRLMFRPFLHWWDKNLVEILQSQFCEADGSNGSGGGGSGEDGSEEDDGGEDDGGEDDGGEDDGGEEVPEEAETSRALHTTSKKGTEIRFVGLDTSQTLGTAFWTTIKVVLSCSRCKNHQEIELKEERLYSTTCGRCSNSMRVMYHLALIHASAATLGYLELTSCTPVDVVFQSSSLTVTCLNCNSEVISQGFFVGQPKDVYCRRCHDKITINASGVRFVQHQQSDFAGAQPGSMIVLKSSKKQADVLLKDGQPLPEYGICQHYKKSHRWLRFPCCGRAFPCDVCHDAAQDHPMEHANRMICGYCSKEQGYSGECARCRSDLTSSKSSAHWEGGQGCRNKVKMSRLDRQKYRDSAKTTCKKSERVGSKSLKTDDNA